MSKVLHNWPFAWRNHRSPVVSPCKLPVMQKLFPCHDLIMHAHDFCCALFCCGYTISLHSKNRWVLIEVEPKWPPIYRWHFLNNFLEWNLTYFHWKFHLCLFLRLVSGNNEPAFFQLMAWCWTGNKLLYEPVMALMLFGYTRPAWVKRVVF